MFEKEKDRTQRKDFIFVSARVSSTWAWPPGAAGVPARWGEREVIPHGAGSYDGVESMCTESGRPKGGLIIIQ